MTHPFQPGDIVRHQLDRIDGDWRVVSAVSDRFTTCERVSDGQRETYTTSYLTKVPDQAFQVTGPITFDPPAAQFAEQPRPIKIDDVVTNPNHPGVTFLVQDVVDYSAGRILVLTRIERTGTITAFEDQCTLVDDSTPDVSAFKPNDIVRYAGKIRIPSLDGDWLVEHVDEDLVSVVRADPLGGYKRLKFVAAELEFVRHDGVPAIQDTPDVKPPTAVITLDPDVWAKRVAEMEELKKVHGAPRSPLSTPTEHREFDPPLVDEDAPEQPTPMPDDAEDEDLPTFQPGDRVQYIGHRSTHFAGLWEVVDKTRYSGAYYYCKPLDEQTTGDNAILWAGNLVPQETPDEPDADVDESASGSDFETDFYEDDEPTSEAWKIFEDGGFAGVTEAPATRVRFRKGDKIRLASPLGSGYPMTVDEDCLMTDRHVKAEGVQWLAENMELFPEAPQDVPEAPESPRRLYPGDLIHSPFLGKLMVTSVGHLMPEGKLHLTYALTTTMEPKVFYSEPGDETLGSVFDGEDADFCSIRQRRAQDANEAPVAEPQEPPYDYELEPEHIRWSKTRACHPELDDERDGLPLAAQQNREMEELYGGREGLQQALRDKLETAKEPKTPDVCAEDCTQAKILRRMTEVTEALSKRPSWMQKALDAGRAERKLLESKRDTE